MKIFGIPFQIDRSFFITSILLSLTRSDQPVLIAEWIGVLILSITIHEFGHALCARLFGLAPRIKLHAMGGLTSWSTTNRITPIKRIIISLAGPLAGFVLGGLVLLLRPSVASLRTSLFLQIAIQDLLWVNIGWGLFNLLPILPLDGGNIVKGLEEWITKKEDAFFSHVITILVGTSVSIWAIAEHYAWILFLSAWFTLASSSAVFKQLQKRSDRSLKTLLDSGWRDLQKREYLSALTIAQQVLNSARHSSTKQQALQILLHAHINRGEFEIARRKLRLYEAMFGPSPYFQGWLLLETGETAQAIATLESAFKARPWSPMGKLLIDALVAEHRFDDALKICLHPEMTKLASRLCAELQHNSFEAGAYEASARAGEVAFDGLKDPALAYNVACAYAMASRLEEGLSWVLRAIDAGFRDRDLISKDHEIDALRSLPGFELVYQKLSG